MKRIDIYIESSIKGPKRRDGIIGCIVEYRCQNGEPASCTKFWQVENMSAHESVLTAAVWGIGRVKRGCEIVIHVDDAWFVSAVNDWMKDWERRGWVNGKDGEVKHKEMFEKIAKCRKTDIITAEQGLGDEYGVYLRYNIHKKQAESRETA